MKCKKCGFENKSGVKYCGNCGKHITNNLVPIIICSVVGVVILFFGIITIISISVMSNFMDDAKESALEKENEYNEIQEELDKEREDASKLNNTSWLGDSGSYISFFHGDFNWYQTKGDYDNYYTGDYIFKSGEYAYEYITEDLDEYYITEEELDDYFERNIGDINYNKDNLVAISLKNQELIMSSDSQTLDNSHYYGFLIDNGKVLELVNMNTFNTFNFTKE